MTQPGLFDASSRRGKPPQSRHASWTGAVSERDVRATHLETVRRLWAEPHTMHEIAALTGYPLASICAHKAALVDELEFVDFQTVEWGPGRKPTHRTRWRRKQQE